MWFLTLLRNNSQIWFTFVHFISWNCLIIFRKRCLTLTNPFYLIFKSITFCDDWNLKNITHDVALYWVPVMNRRERVVRVEVGTKSRGGTRVIFLHLSDAWRDLFLWRRQHVHDHILLTTTTWKHNQSYSRNRRQKWSDVMTEWE